MGCFACEGSPAPPNDPCGLCGRSAEAALSIRAGSAAPAEHRAELNPNPTIGYPEWRLVPTEPSPEMIEAARLPILCRRDCNVSKATAKDVYRAMLKASPAPEKAPGEWRGISTAPHDGSLILVWRRTDWPDDPFAVVRWEHDGFHEHWWIVHDGKSDHQLRGPEPTHWLPLPAPPALPGGEGEQGLSSSSRDQLSAGHDAQRSDGEG